MLNKGLSIPQSLKSIIDDIFSWSSEKPVFPWIIMGSGLGMGVPLVISGLLGMIEIGCIASIGTLTISYLSEDSPLRKQLPVLALYMIFDAMAFCFGSISGDNSSTAGLYLVLLTMFIALIGGINRSFARCSSVILIFLIIGSSFNSISPVSTVGITGAFVIGEIWIIILVSLIYCLLKRTEEVTSLPLVSEINSQIKKPSLQHQYRHWKKSLHTIKGWLYTLRITLCMIFAELSVLFLNLPRSYWIPLVVVLVVHRNLSTTFSRISMRALGTCVGVVIAGIMMFWSIPSGVFIIIITVLALLRPYLKSRNYLLYTSLMTILIISLLEFNEPYIRGIIFDRLINTIIGLFIALIMGYALWQLPFIQKKINMN